ncbi:PREDICTED: ATP-dependent DNA helicase Q1-like [Acropora digitifera]|uniref:ATP-dependent DNA helicase Q1-like n=1 Tax=Acropora digitifera TaxID=70779 RepID=UPI00077AB334|nr:PREDICTED: ATP-dependent DNA helicase Q1-like [Acropora digitifera]
MELAKELDEIDLELKDIETNVESLLKRQVFLQSRKQLIQAQISSGAVDNSLPSTSAKKEDNQNWSVRTFPWSEKIEKAREDIFKIKKFRPLQLECMNAAMAGKDCILIMPTGGGKSLCFQLPSVISKGMTLVISPLISLMEDQLMALNELKIESALLNSKCSKEEVNSVQSAMVDKKSGLKLLYVTPEKIAKSKRFMAKLEKMFEGIYVRIYWMSYSKLENEFFIVQLYLKNLTLGIVFICPLPLGIVYCFSKKDSVSISSSLMSRGIKAACYHGDLDGPSRSYVHNAWMKNAIQVVVATVAFGMGIDKPDVRFVIHHSLSKSMENYYQESGRAGRDDNRSQCILFYRPFDVFQQSTMVFTEQTGLENLYGMLAYCHDLKTCRRTLTGRHFSEQWKSDECHEMCDNCGRTGDQSDDTAPNATIKTGASHFLQLPQLSYFFPKKLTPKKAKKRPSNRPSHSKTSNASKSKMTKTDGELVRNPSETTVENDDDENDSVSCAKRMKPSKQLFIDDSDDDDTSEIVVLD